MKKLLKSTFLTLLLTLCISVNVFAAGLVQDNAGIHYQNDDGTNITNTWVEINNVWYQFDANGNCVDPKGSASYTISDGYSVMYTSYVEFSFNDEKTAKSYTKQGLAIQKNGKYYLTPEYATKQANEQIATNVKSAENTAVTNSTEAPKEEVQYCWKTATGKKYHSINNCGKTNPKNATKITVDKAKSLGLTPCSKCY